MDLITFPLGRLLKFIFEVVGHYGYSIIIFTVVTKILLLPINIKQTESTRKTNEISPKMKELQEKYKNDKEKLNAKLLELYKEHNYNPASGCLPALIQMPIVFALFYVIQQPVKYVFGSPEVFNNISKSLWWIADLGKPETASTILRIGTYGLPFLAVLSGLTTYFQMKMIQPKTGNQDPSSKMMTNAMPVLFAWIALTVPAGLALYWTVGNVFSIVQQYFMIKPLPASKEVK